MLYSQFPSLRKDMLLSLLDDVVEVMQLTPNQKPIGETFDQIGSALSAGKHDVLIVTRLLISFLQYSADLNKTMIVWLWEDDQ